MRLANALRLRTLQVAGLTALFAIGTAACTAHPTAQNQPAAQAQPDAQAPDVVRFHYLRPDENYEGWNIWVWELGHAGQQVDLTEVGEHGATGVASIHDPEARLGFIVRQGEWIAKDIDSDRFVVPMIQNEVFLVSGNPEVFGSRAQIDLTPRITGAFLDALDAVTLGSATKLTEEQIAGTVLHSPAGPIEIVSLDRVASDAATSTALIYTARLGAPIDDSTLTTLSLSVPGTNTQGEPMTVYAREVLSAHRFTADPSVPLGPIYEQDATVFRTWSPVSSAVELSLYENGVAAAPRVITLEPTTHGLWEATVSGDLDGTPYLYSFTSYGEPRVAPDIHTFAATGDSAYSVVVDLDRLAPEGWDEDAGPTVAHQTDEVLYEIHVRDYSATDPTCDESLRGTYLGLTNEGTKSVIPTGIKHLTDLGVSAVHLMPVHDYTAPRGQYNWGYWTALFNVPESNYATSEEPGLATLELRTAIQSLHSAEIRVILDVVYNHTSTSLDYSPFHNTVPYYYHRTTPDGRLMNDSGTGNAIADERPMVREYIADSLEFWTTQYHVDGFRFDLLGMHRPDSVAYWTQRLKAIRPDLTLYGEPWTGGGTTHYPKGAQRGTPMAVFNDHLRNAIRGDLDGDAQGFATGPGGDREAIKRGVMGAIDDFANEPGETVSYVSAHDNLTLWDKIKKTNPAAGEPERLAMHRLSVGIVLTSQGAAFLHGGSDFARTKQGDHNSYEAGDEINAFDWRRKWDFKGLHNFVRGLIAIRNQHPAFRMRSAADIRENLTFLPGTETSPLVFTIDGSAVGDSWRTILVAYNPETFVSRLILPDDGAWNIAADNDRASPMSIGTAQGFHEMQPYSLTVLFRE
ncbi:MAG: pullulanase [Phycisphaerales bacterium]|jgi:pullulanase